MQLPRFSELPQAGVISSQGLVSFPMQAEVMFSELPQAGVISSQGLVSSPRQGLCSSQGLGFSELPQPGVINSKGLVSSQGPISMFKNSGFDFISSATCAVLQCRSLNS